MASASSTSARSLFVDSKMRLADRVQVNVNNIASLARQIQRGSRSSEILMHSMKNFTPQEHTLENSDTYLRKLLLMTAHYEYQLDAIEKSCIKLEEVTEQARAMQR
ncbi:BLOC-1-related complex subunit 7 [Neodiprion pinetum]|uniref:BLOC-1-related complex subunit 7 n=1 Tax=Neodiprion lecontei TaxID=441921 RepID=A0A6J0B3D5_NEOLC|nr:BLOC-1-related complex subunit 7 isoform X1 [Neodiprion lecontei]XP_046467239.1 BLOC-1-related complex subunit 7 isoform X1 [Neodiprion pinetum]